ncbi:probable DNA helicase MCM9 [Lycium barbarum]|uniref:probable DNA helicase MCM9 n=1 Tax=Lycium barbarum TaxID=112863 RepID=UPI00293EE556|nr:probable DNA helicase MCM9 [Lycium barbarum]XP_060167898.1 probable DNA helicase MCM9 [Lycium barbarum]XP_060167899.1 probable DNA helicase MCM9 [Lycium barbarum]XP_060167900.1 probable DNA helicase MCM9 [Lycium barbarum]
MEGNVQSKEMAAYLLKQHSEQLSSIILCADPRLHYSLYLDFAEIIDDNPTLSQFIFAKPTHYLPLFDQAALWAQKVIWADIKQCESASVKDNIHVRINISGSPLECPETFPSIGRVRVKHRGILLTIKGTVIRSGAVKMIEGERIYECRRCKHRFKVYPEVETRNSIPKPIFCPSQRPKFCESTSFQLVEDNKICHDYQEIKIQESTQVLGVGAIPRSLPVILKDDLVDMVKAGDDVIVTGILTAKWSTDLKDVRCDLDPVLIANHVRRMNELKSDIDIPDDAVLKFKQFWAEFKDTPLKGRNAILRGICPQVFGLFTVKLAVALTLIGGVQHVDASGTKVRGESHLLLVGDPGTGKSQFLKFAAKLSNRSVITTGLGSTSAGLTVTAVKDGGEWMLEAGALVLADGGLCCIDEFDSMREHDRATIHEAMEQQTISVAKAGLVTTLSTRTIVFGATNPKGLYDPEQPLSVNTTLSGPLLSRFDIVLVLLDTKNPEWDAVVSSHILAEAEPKSHSSEEEDLGTIWPLPMLRRYIQFVKKYFRPVLTKEAEKVISSYYQLQRRSATQNAARTTVRMLESLIRLAQAHARLMFRNEVTRLDAITAILCIESSMTTSAIVDSMGNALHSNFAENPDQEYAKQERLILERLSLRDEFPEVISTGGSICR